MIYKVKNDKHTYNVDDNVFFTDQEKTFKDAFESVRHGNIAEFDNCIATLLGSDRIIITIKEIE